MMKNKFHVGDRVMITNEAVVYISNHLVDPFSVGTICNVPNQPHNFVGVEFDTDIKGHDCEGTCKPGHGWFVIAEDLVYLEDNDTDITASFSDKDFNDLVTGGGA